MSTSASYTDGTLFSIIIPTYNEADNIAPLVAYLRQHATPDALAEVIVVDGGSMDATVERARDASALDIRSPRKGRAAQMNVGAGHARGDILYFLHADTYPPPTFAGDIHDALRAGCGAGSFQLAFDDPHPLLWLTSRATHRANWLRFGDQSLFVKRDLFHAVGGFDERLTIFEDQDLVTRLRLRAPFAVVPRPIVTSARKFRANGVFTLLAVFALLTALYYAGSSQGTLLNLYRRLIRQDKI